MALPLAHPSILAAVRKTPRREKRGSGISKK
jgi:hypothetical protein